jgi:hypothetical protein
MHRTEGWRAGPGAATPPVRQRVRLSTPLLAALLVTLVFGAILAAGWLMGWDLP